MTGLRAVKGLRQPPTLRDGDTQSLVDLFLNLGMTGNHLLNRFVQGSARVTMTLGFSIRCAGHPEDRGVENY